MAGRGASWQANVEKAERAYRSSCLCVFCVWPATLCFLWRAHERVQHLITFPCSHANTHAVLSQVIREERSERELRKAEMEANKMANLVEHENEIYSR